MCKNKKILIIEVMFESNLHFSLLDDSTVSDALNFRFYLFYCNLKEEDIRRKVNSKNKNIYMQNQYH